MNEVFLRGETQEKRAIVGANGLFFASPALPVPPATVARPTAQAQQQQLHPAAEVIRFLFCRLAIGHRRGAVHRVGGVGLGGSGAAHGPERYPV